MPLQTLHARLMLRRPLLDRLQALDGIGRNRDLRAQRRQLLAQRPMPMPAVADRRGQIAKVELLPQFFLFFFQAGQLALEHAAVAGQADVGVGLRLLFLDLPADLLPLVHELRDLARAAVLVEDAGSASFPVPA